MIRFRIKSLLEEKSFKDGKRYTIKDLIDATGMSRPTFSRIANEPGYSTTTDTINLLCEFFECQPGELMEYIPDEE
jgi:putative transcriptional regulator